MALTISNIKKWTKMLLGKSVAHVNQNLGRCFRPGELKGYFNNLTEKVTMRKELLETDRLPTIIHENNQTVEFPVEIFQYGLGTYDLFLSTHDQVYYTKFKQCVDWAVNHIRNDGAWDNFSYIYPDNPYGAMCQGEGASLLLRAYVDTNNRMYLELSKKAIDFMLKPLEEGGTTIINDKDVIFQEYTHLSTVLNGWIFAIFGLYDFTLLDDSAFYKAMLNRTINTIIRYLPKFDNGYWSLYDLDNHITSMFYHKLHIAQLEALYLITGESIFQDYCTTWKKYISNPFGKTKAFFYKSYQKIIE